MILYKEEETSTGARLFRLRVIAISLFRIRFSISDSSPQKTRTDDSSPLFFDVRQTGKRSNKR